MRKRIENLVTAWEGKRPTRQDYLEAAGTLTACARQSGRKPLWRHPPYMVTATVDDGWGHGLEVIQTLAAAAGVRVDPLGVLMTSDAITAACHRKMPDLLGLTVLQFDSEDAVRRIVAHLPPVTTLVAGGAAYQYDPDFAVQTQTPFVALSGAAFLRFLLNYHPPERP